MRDGLHSFHCRQKLPVVGKESVVGLGMPDVGYEQVEADEDDRCLVVRDEEQTAGNERSRDHSLTQKPEKGSAPNLCNSLLQWIPVMSI